MSHRDHIPRARRARFIEHHGRERALSAIDDTHVSLLEIADGFLLRLDDDGAAGRGARLLRERESRGGDAGDRGELRGHGDEQRGRVRTTRRRDCDWDARVRVEGSVIGLYVDGIRGRCGGAAGVSL